MTRINKFKNMITGLNGVYGDRMFETYYGTLIANGQEGGPNANEARRDFEYLRNQVNRISIY